VGQCRKVMQVCCGLGCVVAILVTSKWRQRRRSLFAGRCGRALDSATSERALGAESQGSLESRDETPPLFCR
jgi:hypothetical protein